MHWFRQGSLKVEFCHYGIAPSPVIRWRTISAKSLSLAFAREDEAASVATPAFAFAA